MKQQQQQHFHGRRLATSLQQASVSRLIICLLFLFVFVAHAKPQVSSFGNIGATNPQLLFNQQPSSALQGFRNVPQALFVPQQAFQQQPQNFQFSAVPTVNDPALLQTIRNLFNQRLNSATNGAGVNPIIAPTPQIVTQTPATPTILQQNLLLGNRLSQNLNQAIPNFNQVLATFGPQQQAPAAAAQRPAIQPIINNFATDQQRLPPASLFFSSSSSSTPTLSTITATTPSALFPSTTPSPVNTAFPNNFLQLASPVPTLALQRITLPPGLSDQLNAVTQVVQAKPTPERQRILADASRIQDLLAQLIKAQTDIEIRRTSVVPTTQRTTAIATTTTTQAPIITTTTTTVAPTTTSRRAPPPAPPIILPSSLNEVIPVSDIVTARNPIIVVPPGTRFRPPTLRQLQEAIPITLPKGLDPNLNFDVKTFLEVFEREKSQKLRAISTTQSPFEQINEILAESQSTTTKTSAVPPTRVRSEFGSIQLLPGGILDSLPSVASLAAQKNPAEQARLANDTLKVLSLLNEIRRAQSIIGVADFSLTDLLTQSGPEFGQRIRTTPLAMTNITTTATSSTQPASESTIGSRPVTESLSSTPSTTSAPSPTPSASTPTAEIITTTPEPTDTTSTSVQTPQGVPLAALLGGGDGISISLPNLKRKAGEDLFLPPVTYRPTANETLSNFLGKVCINFRCGVRFIRVNEAMTQLTLKLRPIKGVPIDIPEFLRAALTTEAQPLGSTTTPVPTSPVIPTTVTPAQQNPLIQSLCKRFKCNFKFVTPTTPSITPTTPSIASTTPSIASTTPSVETTTPTPSTTLAPVANVSSRVPSRRSRNRPSSTAAPPTTTQATELPTTTSPINTETQKIRTETTQIVELRTEAATEPPITVANEVRASAAVLNTALILNTDRISGEPATEAISSSTSESPTGFQPVETQIPTDPEILTAPIRIETSTLSQSLRRTSIFAEAIPNRESKPIQLVQQLQGFYFNRLYSTLFEALSPRGTRA